MSARIYDVDGTPMRRDRDGDLVPDLRPSEPIPDPCPDCGLRAGRHVFDCSIGGTA